jgi:glycosyltransferase involved in cell wall biosynthesis
LGSHKAETLLDGVNSIRYKKEKENRESIRKKWDLPTDRFIFVYTGALIPNKGLLPMISAMKMFLASGEKKVLFVLAGFPLGQVKHLLQEQSLEEGVRVISPLSYFDLPELLSVCDVGIDPKDSVTHQASGKILNYMASGLPVVCFDRDNNRRYLGEGGVYCKDGAEGLLEGLRYCFRQDDEMLQKGLKNRQQAQKWSWERSAEKIEKLIYSHLPKGGKRDILKKESI